jgi:transposase InsO family protein
VLAFFRWGLARGKSGGYLAGLLGIKPDTVKGWQRAWVKHELALQARGRPIEAVPRATRQAIIALFYLVGPGIGVPTLKELFPNVPRAHLEDMVHRYRNIYRKKGQVLVHVLKWMKPGWVWAMDFKEAPCLIDGCYRYVLCVRDLGSGKMLLSLPVTDQESRTVRWALMTLFVRYGPPLMVKSDNGSGFIGGITREYLSDEEVWHLLSPPGTPEYNGSCEAGIGGLNVRATYESARHGRPGQWTCDDVETARLIANETSRPFGETGPTPDQRWAQREPITEWQRTSFAQTVYELEKQSRTELGYLAGVELAPSDQDKVNRLALTRALVERDILQIRRRRFPLPINPRRWRKIS